MDPEQTADPPRRGLGQSARSLLGALADLASARASLLLIEATEARQTSRVVARFAAAGLVAIAAGYSLLLLGLAQFAAGRWFGGGLLVPAAGLAAVHLLAGSVLMAATRARLRRARLFEASLQQFRTDRQWLDQIQSDLKKNG